MTQLNTLHCLPELTGGEMGGKEGRRKVGKKVKGREELGRSEGGANWRWSGKGRAMH